MIPLEDFNQDNLETDIINKEVSVDNQWKKRCIISNIVLILCVGILIFLWLAESQFTEGILRPKYLDETCGFSIFTGKTKCVSGLECISEKCHLIEKTKNIVVENPNCYYKNMNQTKTTNCKCPEPKPCKIVTNYFAFNEFPNTWFHPSSGEMVVPNYGLPYGGCKETCSHNSKCKFFCYTGLPTDAMRSVCLQRTSDPILPGVLNKTWTCSIKVTYT